MDCGKDAARIEAAASGAGADGVRISVATHVMSLEAPLEKLPDIERAVADAGFGTERLEENDEGTDSHQAPGYRRALWIVVLLNIGYGIIEMAAGFFGGSQALKADALDFIGDGFITLLALVAVGWTVAWRAMSALIQGVFLGFLGLGVLVATLYRLIVQTSPDAGLMGVFGVGALIVNVLAVLPLLKHREGDANMRAIWLFSRNDAIGNLAVVIAAGLVALFDAAWPDHVVAFGIAALFLHASWTIIQNARSDLSTVKCSLRLQQFQKLWMSYGS
ncbi:cation transporter [Pseudohalocynthiibacter aestuariivivens]|uniref:Cation transporter n=2 Tax=Pseudohalocynthiibacter aestuariivivens TaxID=1591409 RepID=A0ABV5JJ98_9RHOB|nr:cation transporter [Pseudohalocynthiibacter aestuariivivens]MBS9716752.1 cation transporter [Pseudohalocynthiibacter aestuariivivens]